MRNFFGTNGITATSANHIANMAKEYYENLETKLQSLRFYNTEIELITAGKKVLTSSGISENSDLFQNIQNMLVEISKCKTLIAYLREAIKEKEQLSADVYTNLPLDLKAPERPSEIPTVTTLDILSTWEPEKLLRYYKLQAYAAVFGDSVHKNGSISNARKDLVKIASNPSSVDLKGSDTIITNYTPTISQEKVDSLFFDIQTKFRKYQAEFNGMQAELEDTATKQNQENQDKFAKEFKEYMDLNKEYQEKLNAWKLAEAQRIKSLKIVIPENLKDIYEKINNLSKD